MKFSRHQECISKQLKEADRQNRLLDRGRAVERVRCVERVTRNLGVGDGREVQKGEDICIPMAGSCRGWTENSKIL